MRTILITALLGLLAGALATFAAIERGWLSVQRVSTVIEDVPKMTSAEAESHRDNQFASMRSIEDVLALPSHFAQTEAFFTLAGRSDSAALQNLIFQASGIADSSDRSDALRVLFSRLTELDAASALALSRTDNFRSDRDIETEVWQSWGKFDLEAALRAAASLDATSDRNLAAQALFAAYDYWGNETTERIAESLGIEPDSRTRSLYLSQLADTDPAAAVAYINTTDSVLHRQDAASMLGRHLARSDSGVAARYAALFKDAGLREVYENAVAHSAAQVDPAATLDALLAGDMSIAQTSQLRSAFRELAAQDIDQALAYLERVENPRQLQSIADVIAKALVHEDPDRALAWSKENDRSMYGMLYTQVLSEMARTRPELAIVKAKELTNSQQRLMAFSVISMTISQRDPEKAIQLLDQIEGPAEREAIVQAIASNWLWTDPDAALSWILTMDASDRGELLRDAASMVATDLDTAIRLLPRLDEKDALPWREQIATNLAAQRSVAEAQSFIAQFEGSDDYPRLLSSVISGLARTDVQAAIRMVGQMPAGPEKDSLHNRLIMHFAQQDPEQAAALLASVSDDNQRLNATTQVVSQWSRLDPTAAQQWTQNLPRGQQRDHAIVALTSSWEEMTPARRLLLDSIGSAESRKQAMVGVIYRIARSDPEKAQRMLLEVDLSEEERQQMQGVMDTIRDRHLSSYGSAY